MNGIFLKWFDTSKTVDENLFDKIVNEMLKKKKISKYAYAIIRQSHETTCEKRIARWNDILSLDGDISWSTVHLRNYKCTIETRLRSFYFQIFHNTIGLNAFLYKIKKER